MDALRICLLLLLLYIVCCQDAEVTLVKTIGKEPDLTPICTNDTSATIIMIVCRIRTEKSSGEECRLLYRDGGDFVHECDTRFTLKTRNHTVFLHLTSLTPADSGNVTCECSNLDGTFIHHLKIIVKADEVWNQSTEVILPSLLTAAVLLIILLSVILGFIHRAHPHRAQPESSSHHPDEGLVEIEPYSTFHQKENGLYSTTVMHNCQNNSDNTNIFT